MEGNQLILFMFLIVILCILCIMLGYFYAKTKIRYFYNKFMQEEMNNQMKQQARNTKVIKIKPKNDEELNKFMENFFNQLQNFDENDKNDENNKK